MVDTTARRGQTPPAPTVGTRRTDPPRDIAAVSAIAAQTVRQTPGVYLACPATPCGTTAKDWEHDPTIAVATADIAGDEVAISLELMTRYGQSVLEVTAAVRRRVVERVQAATGLRVVSVNISVIDVRDGQSTGDGRTSTVIGLTAGRTSRG